MLPNGGNVLFLSGPAGNSQGLDELKGLKQVLGPEYKFINPAPFDVTNWDPALTQKVLTAEIAKNDKIDVIVSDFGPSLVGALPLFNKSNRSIPALATSDGNSLGCFWTDNQAMPTRTSSCSLLPPAMTMSALPCNGPSPRRPAARIRRMKSSRLRCSKNSVSGTPSKVQCRKDLPGAIYLSSELPADDQAKAVRQVTSHVTPERKFLSGALLYQRIAKTWQRRRQTMDVEMRAPTTGSGDHQPVQYLEILLRRRRHCATSALSSSPVKCTPFLAKTAPANPR